MAVAALVILGAACSSRACTFGADQPTRVAELAKKRGVQLAVRNCRDAFEGGFQMQGRFSCLAHVEPAQKQQIIDAFGLTKRSHALGWYTPTQTHRCESRIDLPLDQERDRAWKADVWAVENSASTTPGFDSVELHVTPSGEACIELTAAR